jgi:DNA-binding winged helix-turn-helix (wHTH) protein/Tfp pilus assembly protein PilF
LIMTAQYGCSRRGRHASVWPRASARVVARSVVESTAMQFRGYGVDSVHRTVTSPSGRVVRIEPKAFDLLLHFIEHPEEMLSRERLIADVWGGKFVTDDAVMVAVYALRQALDDDSRAPKFIETIRGRGYRWIATAGPPPPQRARTFAAAGAALIAIGFTALVWAVLRPPLPMPSMKRTNELVRANARGVFFSERTTRRDLEEARGEFRKAIGIDERFAEPHAALAQVCVRLIEIGSPDRETSEAEARREAARAIELAPRLAISQASVATVQFVLDRDVERAERSYRYAIELDPALPGVRRRYSYLLGASGRFAEATEQARIATEMDPTSAGALSDLAWTHLLAGRLADAERLYRDAVHLDPTNSDALISLGYCLELRNSPDAAMQSYRRALQIVGVPEDVIAGYDRAYASSGLPGVYAAFLGRLKTNKAIPRMVLALYAVRAGRSSEAIEFLRESTRRREPGTLWLAVHPAFASLRGQREFAGLVASSFHTR